METSIAGFFPAFPFVTRTKKVFHFFKEKKCLINILEIPLPIVFQPELREKKEKRVICSILVQAHDVSQLAIAIHSVFLCIPPVAFRYPETKATEVNALKL